MYLMGHYVRNRLLQLVPILFGITVLTFAMMHFAAGDAVDMIYEQSGVVSEEIKAEKRAELGLDQPLPVQYGRWAEGVLTGDLGRSYISGKPVWETFAEKLPNTALLMVASVLVTLLLAVPLGVIAAVFRGSLFDAVVRSVTFVGSALPNFFVGLLLLYFFALKLGLLPVMGRTEEPASLILPTLTLVSAMGAKYTRQIRAAVLDELGMPYVLGARARGVAMWRILCFSVMKSAFPMILTLLALSVGSLLGGTAIVETLFLWDGVGKMAVDAILMRDYPLIAAYVVWMAILYVAVNLAADLVSMWVDPRMRMEERSEKEGGA
ncbi:putative oligopeptide ABC transporter, permease protein AppB [Mitsuokella sp. oral taxon 131 str. W9106]|nr:putative oligopeptide ABC transporter, permease protein AppB [Mitsuokella sp. oral taxon 131 str. W9106]